MGMPLIDRYMTQREWRESATVAKISRRVLRTGNNKSGSSIRFFNSYNWHKYCRIYISPPRRLKYTETPTSTYCITFGTRSNACNMFILEAPGYNRYLPLRLQQFRNAKIRNYLVRAYQDSLHSLSMILNLCPSLHQFLSFVPHMDST